MFKTLLTLLALFISSPSFSAEQCGDKSELGAEYSFSKVSDGGKPQFKHVMNLWREGKQVAHENLNTNITDLWLRLDNDRIRLIRYFDKDQRAIEYQADEVKFGETNTYWQSIQQMITDSELAKMKLIAKKGEGCQRIEVYQVKTEHYSLTVDWLPEYKLLKSSTKIARGNQSNWQLKNLIIDPQRVKKEFLDRDEYEATDYADIGDNESDPFLQKMIHLGHIQHSESGFYDADGHNLSSGHHDHH